MEVISVPANMVGKLIGRGGENIKKIQLDSGCKIMIDVDKDKDCENTECTLTGSPDAIDLAKSLVRADVSGGDSRSYRKTEKEGRSYEMMLERGLVSQFIGRGGKNIKNLQEETGTRIRIEDHSAYQKILHIYGTSEAIETAKTRIRSMTQKEKRVKKDLLEDVDEVNHGENNYRKMRRNMKMEEDERWKKKDRSGLRRTDPS